MFSFESVLAMFRRASVRAQSARSTGFADGVRTCFTSDARRSTIAAATACCVALLRITQRASDLQEVRGRSQSSSASRSVLDSRARSLHPRARKSTPKALPSCDSISDHQPKEALFEGRRWRAAGLQEREIARGSA